MESQYSRTELLLGAPAIEKLKQARVAVFGVGGVGGFCVEALARCGVGSLELIDNDSVCISNLNRQIIATHDTIGMPKTEAAAMRIKAIDPEIEVTQRQCFYLPENASEFDFSSYDYVVDAIDTVTAKIDIIVKCTEAGVPIISAMGAGNKLDPTKFRVTDIYKTEMDPLAKVMRHELRKRGIKKLKVVYSTEQARKPVCSSSEPDAAAASGSGRRSTPGSISFVPSAAGLIIAGEVVKDLIGIR